jgi:actin-related protein
MIHLIIGGNTMFNGIDKRLEHELKSLLTSSSTAAPVDNIQVIATSERRHAAWQGGSLLASLSTFKDMWISKEVYDEYGPSIVHRICLLK